MANRPITDNEKRAWEFAINKHDGQVRKFTGKSYFDAHVQKVNGIVKQYSTDEVTLIASLCHDIIEDCFEDKWEGYAIIKNEFGEEVANIAMELTSDKDVIKHKFNKSKTNYLISKMLAMTDKALLIKLADRLQNISDAFTASEKFRTSYFHETMSIVEALEKGRELTKEQALILNDIKSKLSNISSIFKIKRFKDMK
jgi:(p)ppGpp synthase/HD superfamily hydrolase